MMNRINDNNKIDNNKGNNINNMDFKTAKNSIDFILKKDNNLKIQFTGGEPLLNFKLIEKIINYCDSNYPDKNLQKRPKNKYCYLNSGDLLFVNELGDIYPCPTLEGHYFMGNINIYNKIIILNYLVLVVITVLLKVFRR